jgi:hypothetical protein
VQRCIPLSIGQVWIRVAGQEKIRHRNVPVQNRQVQSRFPMGILCVDGSPGGEKHIRDLGIIPHSGKMQCPPGVASRAIWMDTSIKHHLDQEGISRLNG